MTNEEDKRLREYEQAMALFDARPQMGGERFSGLTLPQRVERIFQIRDRMGRLCGDLAEQIAPEDRRGIELANERFDKQCAALRGILTKWQDEAAELTDGRHLDEDHAFGLGVKQCADALAAHLAERE